MTGRQHDPKVYASESGKPTTGLVRHPRWKCPLCQAWKDEPMSRVCTLCRRAQGQDH